MRLARLRHQMLIAMGLPACWTQSAAPTKPPSPEPREPPVIYQPPVHQTEIAMFDARTCTVDTIVESVCGRITGEYCEATAKKLDVANGLEGLYVTTIDDARAALDTFILDDKKSEAYVVRLQQLNEKLEGKPACCFSRCSSLATGVAKPLPSPIPYGMMRTEVCIPSPPKGTTLPEPTAPQCPQGVKHTGELRPFSGVRNDLCCYTSLAKRTTVIRGRPARVDGEPRFAELAASSAWSAVIERSRSAGPRSDAERRGDVIERSRSAGPRRDAELIGRSRSAGPRSDAERRGELIDVNTVDPSLRAQLAASWLEVARMEHASIAAFSTTSLRLMAFGAPPALIEQTHRAALDEIAHAQIAFALASAYAGQPIAPAQFTDATRVTPMTLREFAVETFVDGCVGETVAAVEAARAAEVATDPALVELLRRMAADEERHAELAWAIVAWCVRREPAILADLRVAEAEHSLADGQPSRAHVVDARHDLAPHGVLGTVAKHMIHEEVMRDVVAPCLETLAA